VSLADILIAMHFFAMYIGNERPTRWLVVVELSEINDWIGLHRKSH